MCSRWCAVLMGLCAMLAQAAEPLRVCADADNLPFSNEGRRGFENVLAQMIATDLRRPLEFVWRFDRGRLLEEKAGEEPVCGVVLGLPVRQTQALLTAAYYRSSYVFVTRQDRRLALGSFADPRLQQLRIGIYSGDADMRLTPPGRMAAAYGLDAQLLAFRMSGTPGFGHPARSLMQAVAAGTVDVAVGWGPVMGYFASRADVPMTVSPLQDDAAHPDIPMNYDIAMAVPSGNERLRADLQAFLVRSSDAVRQLLADYHVPVSASSAQRERGAPTTHPTLLEADHG